MNINVDVYKNEENIKLFLHKYRTNITPINGSLLMSKDGVIYIIMKVYQSTYFSEYYGDEDIVELEYFEIIVKEVIND